MSATRSPSSHARSDETLGESADTLVELARGHVDEVVALAVGGDGATGIADCPFDQLVAAGVRSTGSGSIAGPVASRMVRISSFVPAITGDSHSTRALVRVPA